MENSKTAFKKNLVSFITNMAIWLTALIVSVCFFAPVTSVKALTKQQITQGYNISFVSAKTRVRSAQNYNRYTLKGKPQGANDNTFDTYKYVYDSTDREYYYSKTAGEMYNDENLSLILLQDESGNEFSFHTPYEKELYNNDFIPTQVTHFKNKSNQLEELFYDEIDDGDYVLINNYRTPFTTGSYNVENFYLSFGTPYVDEEGDHTTPLNDLTVSGMFYNEDGAHDLVLNGVLSNTIDESGKLAHYWYQYFDMQELNAKTTPDASAQEQNGDNITTYAIKNTDGKYVITFSFIRYNEDLSVGSSRESYTYTFYLMNASNYNNYPIIHNAELKSNAENGSPNEYYYHFEQDTPYITYDPTKYSISYTRSTTNITTTVTSTVDSGTYSYNNVTYPWHRVTYRKDGSIVKDLYILTYDIGAGINYIYLADMYGSSRNVINQIIRDSQGSIELSHFEELLQNEQLTLEYMICKCTEVPTNIGNNTIYTTLTYKSSDFSQCTNIDNNHLTFDFAGIRVVSNVVETQAIMVHNEDEYSLYGNPLISFSQTSYLKENIQLGDDYYVINTFDLPANESNTYTYNGNFISPANKPLSLTAYNFKLNGNTLTVEEQYYESPTDTDKKIESQDISLSSTNIGTTKTFTDLVHANIDITVTIKSATTIDVEFKNNNSYTSTISSYQTNFNTNLLNRILDLNSVPIEYSYDLPLEELGRYTIEYSYVVATDTANVINTIDSGSSYYAGSSNRTTPINYFLEPYITTGNLVKINYSTYQDNCFGLWITTYGELNATNSVTLNGITYTYDPATRTVKINDEDPQSIDNTIFMDGVHPLQHFNISVEGTTLYVKKYYRFMTLDEYAGDIKTYQYKNSNNTTIFTEKYSARKFVAKTTSHDHDLQQDWYDSNAMKNIQQLKDDEDNGNLVPKAEDDPIIMVTRTISGAQQGCDILHVFGAVSYFNKDNTHTDNGHSKLKEINSRMNRNYISDVTKIYNSNNGVLPINTRASHYKGFVDTLLSNPVSGFTVDNLIVTDVTPVLWNIFATLEYNGKESTSIIYRYPNAKIVGNTITNIGESAVVDSSYFTKDVYCQYDGLYEVVVIYNYNDDKIAGTKYYQLFTFMIDNSSPQLDTYIWKTGTDEEHRSDTPLGLNKYTNQNIRLQWEIPTYFKNDVYIDIEKEYFVAANTTYNYSATYQQKEIKNIRENTNGYARSTSVMGTLTRASDNKECYYVDIRLPENSTYNLSGTYNIVVHYNMYGKSNFTVQFIIDTEDISGLKAQAVQTDIDKNGNTSYVLASNTFAGDGNIINRNFTFRYNQKASGAKIYVNYDKIDFETYSYYDTLVNANNNKTGITTTLAVAAREDTISVGTPYSYKPNKNAPNSVDNTNFMHSSNSAIFLFRLIDDAGNTAQFVIFYDTTTPRFKISPNDSGPVINKTTNVYWGDYKAIKINTDAGQTIDITQAISNTTEIEGSLLDTDIKLNTIFSYINNNYRKFNNTKIEKIGEDYYILVPISEVNIRDDRYSNQVSLRNDLSTYYFFPKNPVTVVSQEDSYIELLDNNEQTHDYLLVNHSITNTNTARGKSVERYIVAQYFTDNTQTQKAYAQGSIGEGIYSYIVKDELGNQIQGIITMNLDQTLTTAYGIFDYSNGHKNKMALNDATLGQSFGTYAAARIMISSKDVKDNNDNNVPYELTYLYYGYNPTLYSDYYISNVTVVGNENEANYSLELTFTPNGSEPSTRDLVYSMLINDADNAEYPLYSYPYNIQGDAIVADTSGEPTDVYSEGIEYYDSLNGIRYSTTINPTTDTVQRKIVTREGLYIFKRTYTDLSNFDLGNDSKTIYRAYYVDRSGIIELDSGIGENIEFMLGMRDDGKIDPDYQKLVSSATIENNQTEDTSKVTSNANRSSNDLFSTNKVQVEFRSNYDKYNFDKFYLNSYTQNSNINGMAQNIKSILEYNIFNSEYFKTRYKVDLTTTVNFEYGHKNINGNYDYTLLFAESKAGNQYNKADIQKYMTSASFIDNYKTRSNNIRFVFGNPKYYLQMVDHAGYITYQGNTTIVENDNTCANMLKINFGINHNAPQADAYGKYYGRHNYDENLANDGSLTNAPSIPIGSNDTYDLLTKYLQSGQLDPLSNTNKSKYENENGVNVRWLSTNNKTLIFVFTITDDEYQAKIDEDNIKIYKNSISNDNIIFNKDNGIMKDSTLVNKSRMENAWIENTFNNTTYYAIIIFDDNLDEILDNNGDGIIDDNDQDVYSEFRLLDSSQNDDTATYYAELHYVGNKDNYKGGENGNIISYYNTTFRMDIDRIKPMYNVTKLMHLDKYVYNTITTTPTTSNYTTLFNNYYNNFYHAGKPTQEDEDNDFTRSDLENYFFAVDYRQDSSFVFESIDVQDNKDGFYFRKINKNDYNFSITPDDYKAYYNATYLQGHPQFTPSNAQEITSLNISGLSVVVNKYYHIPYSLVDVSAKSISAYYLHNNNIFQQNEYYEIIERDEAGNYRVYGIYIPQIEDNLLEFTYQKSANGVTLRQSISAINQDSPEVAINAMTLTFQTYKTTDNFLKAKIQFNATSLQKTLFLYYSPVTESIILTDQSNNVIETIPNIVRDNQATNYANTTEFLEKINAILTEYNAMISNKNHAYYSEYGYTVYITIYDRIGMRTNYNLLDYKITFNVAGSKLIPTFEDKSNVFLMKLSGQKGSTYITELKAWKFNKVWTLMDVDNSTTPQIFAKTEAEFKNALTYQFGKGVYRFVFKDNFDRVDTYFHEFGVSSSQTGGVVQYSGNIATYSDGFKYTSKNVKYTYDSSIYNVYIAYTGEILDPESPEDNVYIYVYQDKFYESQRTYSDNYKERYGIDVITSGNTTTITFTGVKELSKYSKYEIKTVLASTAERTNYYWGLELENSEVAYETVVYNHKFAIYTGIPNVNIRNLNGNTLDTSNHLNLTEDFELVTAWNIADRIDFNTRIVLKRTYTENGKVQPTLTYTVKSGAIISQPGDYVAYVLNDLGQESNRITFTRGDGQITMYAVYAIDKNTNSERKLVASSYVTSNTSPDSDGTIIFNYFITSDYFAYKFISTGIPLSFTDLNTETSTDDVMENSSAYKYINVRVNSNLSIFAQFDSYGKSNGMVTSAGNPYEVPYVQYKIYSLTNTTDEDVDPFYVYRYIRIFFVPADSNYITTIKVTNDTNTQSANSDLASNNRSTIKSTDTGVNITFGDINKYTPLGDTVYIDRYYNGELMETMVVDMNVVYDQSQPIIQELHTSTVGQHTFVIRDLAGRTHIFADSTNKLQVYLINQIMFTVNGKTPINNQIFNEDVSIKIKSKLDNLTLYGSDLGITYTHNGIEYSLDNTQGEMIFSESGYYSLKMVGTTMLSSNDSSVTDQEISTIYNFVIINENNAMRSFSVSKGTGFRIDSIQKTSSGVTMDITSTYTDKDNMTLLWLTYAEQGNSTFTVKLLAFNEITNKYDASFEFRVWINDIDEQTTLILSSIPAGTETKDKIVINYNPGLIYSQIGNGYIMLNNTRIADINSSSEETVRTITITEKGTYYLKIYTEDGSLIGSYKFIKKEPMSGTFKFILIGAAGGIIVLVGLFLFIRRKGKYR